MAKVGRPTKLTPELQTEIVRVLRAGFLLGIVGEEGN